MRYVLAALGLALIPIAAPAGGPPAADEAAAPEYYTTKVQPILAAHCYQCHGQGSHHGGLEINTRAQILKGGHHGPAIVPGDPDNSLLVTVIRQVRTGHGLPPPMPFKKPRLSDDDIATIERWIKAGAVTPDGQAR